MCEFHPPVRQSDVIKRAAIVMPGAVKKLAAGRLCTLVKSTVLHFKAKDKGDGYQRHDVSLLTVFQ